MGSSTINIKAVKELREKTGLGMLECKSALVETKGDIAKSIDCLKRRGLKIAEKKEGKTTTAGRIWSYIHGNGKIGVLIEINCETDFVAKNEEFQNLLQDLCLQIAAMSPLTVSRADLSPELVAKEKEIYQHQVKEESSKKGAKEKPPEIMERIVQGKLNKFFFSQKCLLDQSFVKDGNITIANLIKSKIGKFGENITVKRFVRFKVGE